MATFTLWMSNFNERCLYFKANNARFKSFERPHNTQIQKRLIRSLDKQIVKFHEKSQFFMNFF
jgi:hypothetical protein